jgi:hypothetical protein
VEPLQKRKGQLADGAGDFEKGEQNGAIGEQVIERGLSAVQSRETEFGRTSAGRQRFSLVSGGHIGSVSWRVDRSFAALL